MEDSGLQDVANCLVDIIKEHPESYLMVNEFLQQLLQDLKAQSNGKKSEIFDNIILQNCAASDVLRNIYGDGLKVVDLIQICIRLSAETNIPVERNVLRKKDKMMQWLDDNIDIFEPILYKMKTFNVG